jgi:hypothetical protein
VSTVKDVPDISVPEIVTAVTELTFNAPVALIVPDIKLTRPDNATVLSVPPSVKVTVSILIRP